MRILKIFIITFIITFLFMFILDIPVVKKYIKNEARKAMMMNAGIRYILPPQGLEG